MWVSLSVLRLDDEHSGTGIAQVQDITEQKLASEGLAYQALHDPLPGLGNRRSLLADLQVRIGDATLERPLLLQLFDLDGLSYNDLRPPGRRRAAEAHGTPPPGRLEGRASAYRMGGDEFCVLSLLECGDHEVIAATASEALAERGEGFQVTASSGSVLLPTEATTATEALREADRRMYRRRAPTAAARPGARARTCCSRSCPSATATSACTSTR